MPTKTTLETVAEAVARTAGRLSAAGVPSPRLDARLLVAHAAALTPLDMVSSPTCTLTRSQTGHLSRLVGRRVDREPISRILGVREFWSLPFAVAEQTLDPRPDSETLVDAALSDAQHRNENLRVLDLGTGTGCLLLALLHSLLQATGTGLDIDAAAVAVAEGNAKELGLTGRARFLVADWHDPDFAARVGGPFDIVVANPPYIPESEINSLDPEVARHDPRRALDGGEDGMDAYRALIPQLSGLLADGGRIYLEIGVNQRAAVKSIAEAHGVVILRTVRDLAGMKRCLVCADGMARDSGGAARSRKGAKKLAVA